MVTKTGLWLFIYFKMDENYNYGIKTVIKYSFNIIYIISFL